MRGQVKRQQLGLVNARRQFFENSQAQVLAERASRERKRIELEHSIGRRSNVFGQVLEDKERMYVDTINSSLGDTNSLQRMQENDVAKSTPNDYTHTLANLRDRLSQETPKVISREISRG